MVFFTLSFLTFMISYGGSSTLLFPPFYFLVVFSSLFFYYNYNINYLKSLERKKDNHLPDQSLMYYPVPSNNMIITNNPYKININQTIYNKIISRLDFSAIICPYCSHNEWAAHSKYERYVNFLSMRFKIKITRIICLHCGRTHAILVEDMIPFSCLGYSDIKLILSSSIDDHVSSSHFYFVKYKYNRNISSYWNICLSNSRRFPVVPTYV